eukprot:TRINITY_DN12703_c0_g1_i1.p2 TRINITY_DN12703_c0_g1~~TRINITY_DN12703_c0_g1_i1.p2  ORF type:complete len:184 (+),score=42.04 TRINITY_DN12703_c0_g1_i1:1022-1573(+)
MVVEINDSVMTDESRAWLASSSLSNEGVSFDGITKQILEDYFATKTLVEGTNWTNEVSWELLWQTPPVVATKRTSYLVLCEDAKLKGTVTKEELAKRGPLNIEDEHWLAVKGIVFSLAMGPREGRDFYTKLTLIPVHAGSDMTPYLRSVILNEKRGDDEVTEKALQLICCHFYEYLPLVGCLE